MASAASIDFVAAARAHYERRERVSTFGHPLDLDRPVPALRAPEQPDDIRPPAPSREPCRRCQARGDLGCEHQRPYEPRPEPKGAAAPEIPRSRQNGPKVFTAEEDERLIKGLRAGLPISEVALAVGRPKGSLYSRLATLERRGKLPADIVRPCNARSGRGD